MRRTVTIEQLRKDPASIIRDVKDGATLILTERGRPIADITPHGSSEWRPASEVSDVLERLGPDPALAADVDLLRDESELADPWVEQM